MNNAANYEAAPTGSTPESLAARFALIQQSATSTNASTLARMLRWDNQAVNVTGRIDLDVFLLHVMALQSEARSLRNAAKVKQYSDLATATASLADAIADWHNHNDDDEPAFLSFDPRFDLGVSR